MFTSDCERLLKIYIFRKAAKGEGKKNLYLWYIKIHFRVFFTLSNYSYILGFYWYAFIRERERELLVSH